jgi:hypothetical protein
VAVLRISTSTSLTLGPSAVSDMAAHDDDQDEGSIPLLETEPSSSSREPIFSKRRAQQTSPPRFVLATALLVLGGLAAFYLWTTGRPAYNKHSRHWNPHSKQLYFRNGTAAEERELARSSFGRAKDLGIDKFDLVASVYYRQQPENRYRVTPTEREDGTRKAVDGDLDRAVARLLAPKVREEDEGTQKERGQSFIYPLELLGSNPLG